MYVISSMMGFQQEISQNFVITSRWSFCTKKRCFIAAVQQPATLRYNIMLQYYVCEEL